MYPYHNEPDFSVHTFEIRLLDNHKDDYYKAFENAFAFCVKHKRSMYDPNKRKRQNNEVIIDVDINHALNDNPISGINYEVYVCEALSSVGLTITFVRTKKFGIPVDYDIRMVINPRRIMGDDTYVGILDVRRIDDMIHDIYTALDFIGCGHLCLEIFRLHRIDMCRNVFLGSQFLVETYIGLLKKCFVPCGYTWNEVGDEELGIKMKDGIIIANNSVAITVYNKQAYMKKQKGYFAPIYIEEAEGLIRFEIKLYADRIRTLCKMDNNLNNLIDFFYCCERLSREHFEIYIPKVFLRGNYFTLEDARIIIEKSNYQEPVKKKMLMLINRISIHQNFMVALEEVVKVYNPPKPYDFIRNLIQNFDNIYLNPVTIPRRRVEPGEMFLPGAYNLIMGIETLMFRMEN